MFLHSGALLFVDCGAFLFVDRAALLILHGAALLLGNYKKHSVGKKNSTVGIVNVKYFGISYIEAIKFCTL